MFTGPACVGAGREGVGGDASRHRVQQVDASRFDFGLHRVSFGAQRALNVVVVVGVAALFAASRQRLQRVVERFALQQQLFELILLAMDLALQTRESLAVSTFSSKTKQSSSQIEHKEFVMLKTKENK